MIKQLMKIAICDDFNYDKRQLATIINDYCEINFITVNITEYNSGESLLKQFKKGSFTIIFLDIYMNELNGIDTAKEIRVIDNDCLLAFVTTSHEHAVEGFSVNALHYLIKPITADKIAAVFNRCQKIFNAAQQSIEVISNRLLVKILTKTIHYIEVYDKVCLIHKDSEVIKTYLPLEEIAKQLDTKKFLYCHRSYIVNMRYITSIEDNDFILQSGKRIPIRKSEKQSLKQMYMDYLFALAREEHHVC